MATCLLSSIILVECVHLITFLAISGELCMNARTHMQRCTMKLRSRQKTYINLTNGERLRQLKLIVYFLHVCEYHLVWFIRVPLVEQELLTVPEHLSSPPIFSGVRVTRSLVSCIRFVDRCLSYYTFSVGHCIVCSSSIYGFWLPSWYPQVLHTNV